MKSSIKDFIQFMNKLNGCEIKRQVRIVVMFCLRCKLTNDFTNLLWLISALYSPYP